MAMGKPNLKPGVLAVATQTLASGTYWASLCIRWFLGMWQKIGGWMQLTSQTLIGTCRGMHGWSDLVGNPYLACGTEQRLEVLIGGVLVDITPLRQTSNIAPAFTTTNLSKVVEVHDIAHGAVQGDWVDVPIPVSIGGIIIQGFYLVQSVIDADHYTIQAAVAATASAGPGGAVPLFTTTNTSPNVQVTLNNHGLTAGAQFETQVSTTVGGITIGIAVYGVLASPAPSTNTFDIAPGGAATSSTSASENGGNCIINYLLPTGLPDNQLLGGYGGGEYGGGDYGGGGGATISPLRRWSLDNWGELLLASPTNLALYAWTPTPSIVPTPAPAVIVSGAPAKMWLMFIIAQLQVTVALGAESGGTQFPLLVRWSDVGDYTDWTPTPFNEAGSEQIATGSRLISGLAVGQGALLWTDLGVYTMVYIGLPFVFAFNPIAKDCEAMASSVTAIYGNNAIWPSIRGFYKFDGSGVGPFPCPVWDFLFKNVDYNQLEQMFQATNTLFNEIAWHFPFSLDSPFYSAETPFGYVKFNFLEGLWDYGVSAQMQRTAWTDHPGFGTTPVAVDLAGLIQQHETGTDANGAALVWSITSGYFDFSEGEDFGFSDFFLPDINATPTMATVMITFYAIDYPGQQDTPIVYGPYPFTPKTNFLGVGIRARQIAVKFSGSDMGSAVRQGAMRWRTAKDGRN